MSLTNLLFRSPDSLQVFCIASTLLNVFSALGSLASTCSRQMHIFNKHKYPLENAAKKQCFKETLCTKYYLVAKLKMEINNHQLVLTTYFLKYFILSILIAVSNCLKMFRHDNFHGLKC